MSDVTLNQVMAVLLGIRSDLETAGFLPSKDRDAALLKALGDVVGGRIFTAAELIHLSEVHDGPLARVLSEALAGKVTSRGVGKLLSRVASKPAEGLNICALGKQGNCTLWAVRATGFG